MQISSVFNDLHEASKSFYAASGAYFKEKQKLAKMLNDYYGSTKLTKEQKDMIRKSANGQLIRDARNKNEYNLEAAYTHYLRTFKEASERLAEAVSECQPALDVNDPTLQNTLEIVKIGKNLPEATVRNLLYGLRANKANFDIVKSAMERAGIEKNYFRGIYAFDGDDMQMDYDLLVEEMRGKNNASVYSKLSKIQDRIIRDAAAFGVTLEPYISAEDHEAALDYSSSKAMGLLSSYEQSTEFLGEL